MDGVQMTNNGGDYLFAGLNSEQAEAVRHVDGPLLILAGAGSGKTRVLVHKIAYLILEAGVPPWSIMGITFTNKAANEMKNRVESFLPYDAQSIWISTFHSACVRILRRDIERIGFSRSFSILDQDDQISLVKTCVQELGLSDKQYIPKAVLEMIGRAKDEMLSPSEYAHMHGADAYRAKIGQIFSLYQQRLKKLNALDFDDIIIMAIRLFYECDDVLSYYQNRFSYILVDEYQDTNTSQYTLISLLSGKRRNLCVVGDDDQSIYSWRGANIKNILSFEKEFKGAKIIKLEQNYRSTKTILSAAYSVIHKNTERKDKKLWTDNEEGEAIRRVAVDNEHEEAAYAVRMIKALKAEQGLSYNDVAILYRVNAQSRAMENMLAREALPYRIIGGFKFFERKEIKDVLAYLRLLLNPSDDISFKRAVNEPRRGVGAATIMKLESRAASMGLSIYAAATAAIHNPGGFLEIKPALGKLEKFISLIQGLSSDAGRMRTADILEAVLERSGIYAIYKADRSDEAKARLENILEFKSEIIEFEKSYRGDDVYYGEPDAARGVTSGLEPDAARGVTSGPEPDAARDTGRRATLAEFLMHISLISDIDSYNEDDERVSLMTIHSAKGLEYETVFIIGAEEGIFPGLRAMNSPAQMEEERRLCYVAITRAKKRLHITHAASRTLFGNTTYNRVSRFIADIPNYLLLDQFDAPEKRAGYKYGGKSSGAAFERKPAASPPGGKRADGMYAKTPAKARDTWANTIRTRAGIQDFVLPGSIGADAAAPPRDDYESGLTYSAGDAVSHKKYGAGVVSKRYMDKNDYIIEIEFSAAGMKRFIESMVKLKRI